MFSILKTQGWPGLVFALTRVAGHEGVFYCQDIAPCSRGREWFSVTPWCCGSGGVSGGGQLGAKVRCRSLAELSGWFCQLSRGISPKVSSHGR